MDAWRLSFFWLPPGNPGLRIASNTLLVRRVVVACPLSCAVLRRLFRQRIQMRRYACGGYSVIELIVVLVIVATVAGLAVPGMRGWIARYRVQGALNRVAAEVHHARMVAVESGASTHLILHPGPGGCVERIRVVATAREEVSSISAAVVLPGLCMRNTGDSILTFNSRGMLRPPARSIRVSHGATADSVVLSIAGRVRRTY